MLSTSNFQNNIPASVSLMSIGHVPLHTHKHIQILYVLNGEVNLSLSFSKYLLKKGDVFVVHYGDLHSISGIKGSNHVIALDINTEYFKDEYDDLVNRFFVSYLMQSEGENERNPEINRLIEEIFVHFAHGGERDTKKTAELTRKCIDYFYKNFQGFSVNKDLKTFESRIFSKPYQINRISNVISTIYANSDTKLTLEDVAATLHIDKFYLSHLIKGFTGVSFQNLLGMARVEYSEEYLLGTEMSIYEIALAVGFSNVSYYEKHFSKWYEMSPDAYRDKYREKTILHNKPDVIRYPVTQQILHDFESHFYFSTHSNVVEIQLSCTSHIGPTELAPFHERYQAFCEKQKNEETKSGLTPILKTPSYYLNYYYSRLLPIKSDAGPNYVVSRSGKDFYLFLFGPSGEREYKAEISLSDVPGKYHILEYKIDPSNSVLNYWKLLGSPTRVNPEEMRAIEAVTHPRLCITSILQTDLPIYQTIIESGTASYIVVRQS